jgi:hypothetical protein
MFDGNLLHKQERPSLAEVAGTFLIFYDHAYEQTPILTLYKTGYEGKMPIQQNSGLGSQPPMMQIQEQRIIYQPVVISEWAYAVVVQQNYACNSLKPRVEDIHFLQMSRDMCDSLPKRSKNL